MVENPKNSFAVDTVWDDFEGDAELICEVIEVLVRELPQWVQSLEELAHLGDLTGVARAAHKISGGVGTMAAGPLLTVIGAIEADTRAGDWSAMRGRCRQLQVEQVALVDDLNQWSRELRSAGATAPAGMDGDPTS